MRGKDDAELWELTRAARHGLAEDLARLTDVQWHRRTLCREWDVEHVVAHLTAAASTGRFAWVRSMVAAGFRPAVHNDKRLRDHLGSTPVATLQRFRAAIDRTTAPGGDTAAWLGEVVVHAQDIRTPLGIRTEPDMAALTSVAEFFSRRDFAVDSRTVAADLRLESTDGPFRAGRGPRVRGTTLALVMTMAGRPAYVGQLEGPGVELLGSRVGAWAGP